MTTTESTLSAIAAAKTELLQRIDQRGQMLIQCVDAVGSRLLSIEGHLTNISQRLGEIDDRLGSDAALAIEKSRLEDDIGALRHRIETAQIMLRDTDTEVTVGPIEAPDPYAVDFEGQRMPVPADTNCEQCMADIIEAGVKVTTSCAHGYIHEGCAEPWSRNSDNPRSHTFIPF